MKYGLINYIKAQVRITFNKYKLKYILIIILIMSTIGILFVIIGVMSDGNIKPEAMYRIKHKKTE